ncbi:ATP-binding protein [Streptomyces phyllanthi]|uniref:ATP-binding protein n=1 Tax=Streptomyces phyllanthi TaxID=1803180 RepID=A0A5N8W1A0_9ACTN|nr:ATP-binding protein [Streptomyces phyllanthi]MPY41293.1 ATP-binding protein [Streptomyces phyllanthi]
MREQYRVHTTGRPAGPGRDRRGPRNPAEARNAVRRAVSDRTAGTCCDEDTLSDALLVVSELTTNAMLHGGGVTEFDVALVGRELYVSVSDRDHRVPVASPAVDDHGRMRCGGRGWPIVCRLSRDVTVSGLPSGGKRITAVVPLGRAHREPGGSGGPEHCHM